MNQIQLSAIKNYYDEQVIGKLKGFVYGNERVERAWEELRRWVHVRPGKSVLEIGCGIGDISYRYAKQDPSTAVFGFDVSERSINIAKTLFAMSNLTFLVADDISLAELSPQEKFGCIFLIDVFEHIPKVSRSDFYRFVKERLDETGIVFLSCPTIAHQSYLREHNPAGLQPIDEDVSIEDILEFSNATGLPIRMFKEISVWNSGDYFHAVLGKRTYRPFSDRHQPSKRSIKSQIRDRITGRQQRLKDGVVLERLNRIRQRLGNNIYELVKQ